MDSIIEIKDVTAGYGKKVAIENISLSIKKEEFVGIIGPNGSGKTTLLKVIMGTLKPFKGSVSVLGTSPEKVLKKMGFVPQFFNDDPFQPFITLEVVLFGLYPVLGPFKRVRKKEVKMCMEALRQVGMEEMAQEPFGHLSGGQMRRVMIARAIVGKPEILILDEPTSGLDVESQRRVISLLAELQDRLHLTVLLVTHNINQVVQYISTVVYIKRKLYAVGKPEKVMSKEVLSSLYGANVDIFKRKGQICVMIEDTHA